MTGCRWLGSAMLGAGLTVGVAEGQEQALVEQFQAAAGVEFAELNYLVSIR